MEFTILISGLLFMFYSYYNFDSFYVDLIYR